METKIQSQRTILRRLQSSDFENMRRLESNPLIMKFTPSRTPQTEEQTRIRLEAQIANRKNLEPYGIWVADLQTDGSFVGWFMLRPTENGALELGFMLVEEQWNKGLATEISKTLIDFARKNSKPLKIIAKTDVDNTSSIKTLEKLGFKFQKLITMPQQDGKSQTQLKYFELV